jgi:polysaccharide biosynthesis transport protein
VAEGKSTVALNLAAVFSNTKKNVLLVDTDYHRSTLSEVLGVQIVPGLADVLQGKTGTKDALVPACEGRVQFLPSGKGDSDTADLLSSDTMTRLLMAFKSRADVVIIDSPPFILADALDLATRVDGVILVVRSRQTLRPALVKMVHQIRRAEIPVLGIVMNGVPQEDKRYDRYYSRKQDVVKETLPASISEADEETGLDAQVAAAPEA